MTCCVCRGKTRPNHRYCDRCYSFIRGDDDKLKRRAALRDAYDEDHDGFRCKWSNVLLEERDLASPFHLCFDHLYPVRTSTLVVSSELFNSMKSQLTPQEFRIAIKELAAHRCGKQFDRDILKFRYWDLKAPSPARPYHRLHREELTSVHVEACVICMSPPRPGSYYCPRCRGFVWMHQGNQCMRVKALKEAWDAKAKCFRCHFSENRSIQHR